MLEVSGRARPRLVRTLLALVALLATLALAACGDDSDDETTTATGGGTTTGADAAPAAANSLPPATADGGDFRVVLGAEVNLDPVTGARRGAYLWAAMIEPFVRFDNEGKETRDGIITDWERTDPTTWTFTIREGVTFHDGTPLDAEEAAASLNLNRAEGTIFGPFLANVTDIRATGPTTFVIKTRTPQFNIPQILSSLYAIPAGYYRRVGARGFNARPIGTGPFAFESASPGRNLIAVRYADYWGEPAKADRITFTYAQDPAQRLALVQSGSADLAFDLPPNLVPEIESADNLQLLQVPTSLKVVLALNIRSRELADVRVRRAIAQAIDREAIVSGLLNGAAQATGGLMNVLPSDPVNDELAPDPEAARAELGAAAPTVPFSVPNGVLPLAQELGDAISGELQKVGISTDRRAEEWTALFGGILQGTTPVMFFGPIGGTAPDPDFIFKSATVVNNCPDEQTARLAAEALTKDSVEEAAELYDQINRRMVVELACYVPLYFQTANFAASAQAGGFAFSPLTVPDYGAAGFTSG